MNRPTGLLMQIVTILGTAIAFYVNGWIAWTAWQHRGPAGSTLPPDAWLIAFGVPFAHVAMLAFAIRTLAGRSVVR